MFKSIKGATYPVTDIEKGKEWYNGILGKPLQYDSPLHAIYNIGDFMLSIVKSDAAAQKSEESPVVYWEVDDIDAAYKKLLNSGARSVSEISIFFSSRIARVADPFGNIIGIISSPEVPKSKSLEDRPSETAMTVAFCRALSYIEEKKELKGDDYLAEIFLNEESIKPLKDKAAIDWMKKTLMTDGSYEFLVTRSKYFDSVVNQALIEDLPQIVFLGAGYDTRSFRFANLIKNTEIYELDVRSTQQRKIERLKKANVSIPANFKFVEIDFNKENIADVLTSYGYSKNKRTIFIWEGVVYYLPKKAIEDTFEFVKLNSPKGSIICFDYVMTAPDIMDRYKAKEMIEKMRERYSAEPVQGGFEEGKMDEYLRERGFDLVEHLNPEEIEVKFLTPEDGSPASRITGIFCLAKAVVK